MTRTRDWNSEYLNSQDRKPAYDLWLDDYLDIFDASCQLPILDLGCGCGNDSLYLTERGFRIVSCDKSEAAVTAVHKHIPTAQCMAFDMLDGLPFDDSSFSVVIADLCLHYFKWDDTLRLVRDIRRVLKNSGVLLCRVNSVNDVNHGAGQGEVIEENLYYVNGDIKRFFDQKHVEALFSGWDVFSLRECRLDRFEQPKMVWEAAVRKTGEERHSATHARTPVVI